jgi:hypothetical protein
MPKLRRVRVVDVGLEDPARFPAIHGYEPGSVAELAPSTRHGTDLAAIPATLMYELDRTQHAHLVDVVTLAVPSFSFDTSYFAAKAVEFARRRRPFSPSSSH